MPTKVSNEDLSKDAEACGIFLNFFFFFFLYLQINVGKGVFDMLGNLSFFD